MLAEKSINIDIVDVDEGNLPEDLLDLNPYNTVPTLVDRDLVLYDSRVIIEYLDERFPHPPLKLWALIRSELPDPDPLPQQPRHRRDERLATLAEQLEGVLRILLEVELQLHQPLAERDRQVGAAV